MDKYYGSYATVAEAEEKVRELEAMGYSRDEISIVSKNRNEAEQVLKADAIDDNVEEGVVDGAGVGAALGGLGGLLAAAGALVIPGIGPVLAAGPIAAVITGAITGGAAGAAIGGIAGALSDAGVPEEDARLLDERFNEGDIIVYAKPKDGDDVVETVETTTYKA